MVGLGEMAGKEKRRREQLSGPASFKGQRCKGLMPCRSTFRHLESVYSLDNPSTMEPGFASSGRPTGTGKVACRSGCYYNSGDHAATRIAAWPPISAGSHKALSDVPHAASWKSIFPAPAKGLIPSFSNLLHHHAAASGVRLAVVIAREAAPKRHYHLPS